MRTLKTLMTFAAMMLVLEPACFCGEKIDISFLEKNRIEGDSIEIGEVCDVQCSDKQLSDAVNSSTLGAIPEPGKIKTVTKFEILAHLQKEGIRSADIQFQGKSRMSLSLNSQPVTSAAILGAVRDFILSEGKYDPEYVTIDLIRAPGDILVPEGDIRLDVRLNKADPQAALMGNVYLKVNIFVGEKPVSILPLSVSVRVFKDVLVASKALSKGTEADPSDLETKKIDITKLRMKFVESAEDIAGMVPVRDISAGQIIGLNMFEYPQLVKRGDIVDISLEYGSLMISAKGIALGSGRAGDVINIKNKDSHRVITAVVSGRGTVRVSI